MVQVAQGGPFGRLDLLAQPGIHILRLLVPLKRIAEVLDGGPVPIPHEEGHDWCFQT